MAAPSGKNIDRQAIFGYDDANDKWVAVAADSTGALAVDFVDNFNIPAYDYLALTYVATGNGVGEVETATYKTGGSSGTTVATLTIAYNASNEISSVTKT